MGIAKLLPAAAEIGKQRGHEQGMVRPGFGLHLPQLLKRGTIDAAGDAVYPKGDSAPSTRASWQVGTHRAPGHPSAGPSADPEYTASLGGGDVFRGESALRVL